MIPCTYFQSSSAAPKHRSLCYRQGRVPIVMRSVLRNELRLAYETMHYNSMSAGPNSEHDNSLLYMCDAARKTANEPPSKKSWIHPEDGQERWSQVEKKLKELTQRLDSIIDPGIYMYVYQLH